MGVLVEKWVSSFKTNNRISGNSDKIADAEFPELDGS